MEYLTRRHLPNLRLACKVFPMQMWMRSWSSESIRTSFIDFFKSHEHKHILSSSVIPPKGEGTYFTNAGMNQFKPVFLGTCDPSSKLWDIKRAVNSQKCIRVGGKHNDLEDVGHDLTHHTFFEMLGNWSFGDYFKEEACLLAYQLLREHYQLPLDRLYFTYFAGDEKLNLPADEECHSIWASLGIPPERILPFGPKDNFWDMGATGPCGPCTEIHFDHVGNRLVPSQVNSCSPTLIEIWNLVFMQYNRKADGSLEQLPARHVDTGMGLERITAVMNGTQDNYATDLFKPIFSVIQKISKSPSYAGQLNTLDTCYRILADHARMFSVSISDGLLPRNDNLGHKLRGIINKCIQLSRSEFKVDPTILLPALVQPVVSSLGGAHPELISKESLVRDVVMSAIDHHDKMLDQATRSFNKMMARKQPSVFLSVESVLALEKGHYGSTMSLDFIELLAAERNLHFDKVGYEKYLEEKQTEKPSPSNPILAMDKATTSSFITHLVSCHIPGTDDSFKYSASSFLDSNNSSVVSTESLDCQVKALGHKGQVTQVLQEGFDGEVVLDKTLFYAESGGQEADRGILVSEDGIFTVEDVQKYGGYVIHRGYVTKGRLINGQIVQPRISMLQRRGNMCNHTATHLLHAALQEVLPNTQQQGSNVSWSRMTFDFLTLSKFDSSDLHFVDNKVRECIQKQYAVQTDLVPFSSIHSIPNVKFNASEEYPEEVRLVSILTGDGKSAVSRELCGGTHAPDTSFLVDFCVTYMGSQSQNIKRATCVTGVEAQQAHWNGQLMSGLCHLLSVIVGCKEMQPELLKLVESLQEKTAQIEQFLSERKLLLERDLDSFDGIGGTKIEELISDTSKALVIAKSLLENLTRLKQSENWIVEFMSSLVKSLNKVKQLDLLPKICRDEADACLQKHERKVIERINARNVELLLQQIETALEAEQGQIDAPHIIDVNPDMDPRKVVKTLQKMSCQQPLVLVQQTQGSQQLFISLAFEQKKVKMSPADLASNLLELKHVGKFKGKMAARCDNGIVYSLSTKSVLSTQKVICVFEKLFKGR